MRCNAAIAALAAVASLVVTSASVGADDGMPVVVKSLGPKSMRVRISAGQTLPCDSSANDKIFEGKLDPGWSITVYTASLSVCVEHTYHDFPDVHWSQGDIEWRPMICTWYGKYKHCVPAPDPTIRVNVDSTPPP